MNNVDKIIQQTWESGYLQDYLLRQGYTIIKTTRYKQYDFDYFKEIDSEEKAYWLGFIYADGWVNVCGGRYDFGLALGQKDYEHLKAFVKAIGYKGKIVEIKHKPKGYDKTYISYRVDIHSKIFVENLIKHGCVQNKTFELKKLPEIDEKFMIPFIRGYFDGDGTIVPSRGKAHIEILGTKEFLTDLLSYVGLHLNKWRVHGKAFGQRYGYKYSKYFLDLIYKDSKIHLKRKYDRYAVLVGND